MPFTFRTFLIQPHSMPLDTNKAKNIVLKAKFSEKSQKNCELANTVKKTRKGKMTMRSLASEAQH